MGRAEGALGADGVKADSDASAGLPICSIRDAATAPSLPTLLRCSAILIITHEIIATQGSASRCGETGDTPGPIHTAGLIEREQEGTSRART